MPPVKPKATASNTSLASSDDSNEPPAKHVVAAVSNSRGQTRSSVFLTGTRGGPPPDIKNKPMAVATDDYDAENHREVSFKKDEKIYVTFWSPHTSWWKGWVAGNIGYFPKENVKPLFDVDQADATVKNATVRGGDNSQDKKRRQLISSIASTEEQYVKDIQVIQDVVMRELQALVSSSEFAEIFGNIEKIISESKATLQVFLRKAKTEEPVGDIFLRMARMFESEVVPWAESQSYIICTMEKISSSNSEFQAAVETICAERLGGVSIYELFGKPVRRANECVSIVKMLLMKTPQENSDFKDLTDALEILGRVKEALRVPFEEMENLLKIVAVQNALQGQESLISMDRKFVREFSCQEVLRGGKKASERKALLLTDVLVIVKVKKTGFGQGTVFPFGRMQIGSVPDTSPALRYVVEITSGPKKEKRRFAMVSNAEKEALLNGVANGSSQTPSLVRDSSMSVAAQGSSESLTKKGIFQKFRSARSLSIGGEDPTPGLATSSPSSPPPSGSGNGTTLQRGSSSNTLSSPSPQNKSPRLTEREVLTRSTPSSTGQGVRESARTEVKSPRSNSDERKSPRPTVLANMASAALLPQAESVSESPSRESSAGGSETATTVTRGAQVSCSACGEPVVGNALTSKGKYYHYACYRCTECSISLVGVPFAEKKGVPYCKNCALTLFAEPCHQCGKLITGQFLSAFGEKYRKFFFFFLFYLGSPFFFFFFLQTPHASFVQQDVVPMSVVVMPREMERHTAERVRNLYLPTDHRMNESLIFF